MKDCDKLKCTGLFSSYLITPADTQIVRHGSWHVFPSEYKNVATKRCFKTIVGALKEILTTLKQDIVMSTSKILSCLLF